MSKTSMQSYFYPIGVTGLFAMISLVTGASGFVGGHVAEELCRRGDRVVVVARRTSDLSAVRHLPIEVRYADLGDLDALKAAAKGVDQVFHCAGAVKYVVPYKYMYETNVAGTEKVVLAAAEAGARRIIYASSQAVNAPEGPMSPESLRRSAPSMKDKYSRSKTEAEGVFFTRCAEKGIEGVALRPGVIYGPRDFTASYLWFEMIDKGNVFVIDGGDARFPLIYIGDLLKAFIAASETKGIGGRAYYLDGPDEVTLKKVWDLVSAELGKEPKYQKVSYRDAMSAAWASELKCALGRYKKEAELSKFVVRLFGEDHPKVSFENARMDLGFVPRVTVEEGMKETGAWYRALKKAG